MIKKLILYPVIIVLLGLGTWAASTQISSSNQISDANSQVNDVKSEPSTAKIETTRDNTSVASNNAATSDEISETANDNKTADGVIPQKDAAANKSQLAADQKTTPVAKPTVTAAPPKTTAPAVNNTPSRGSGRTLTMLATAYDPGPASNGKWAGISYLGTPLHYGIVAVDPNVIPLGSRLYIEGYGEGYAADTGGAIKGNRIDLCFDTYEEAINFGMKNVTVTILE